MKLKLLLLLLPLSIQAGNLTLGSFNSDQFGMSGNLICIKTNAFTWLSAPQPLPPQSVTNVINGDLTVNGSIFINSTNNFVFIPTSYSPPLVPMKGAQLFTDGTNICVIIRNDSGISQTNRIAMFPYP